jgi:hypothetical protein
MAKEKILKRRMINLMMCKPLMMCKQSKDNCTHDNDSKAVQLKSEVV